MIDAFTKQDWERKTQRPGFEWTKVEEVQGQLRYTWQVPLKAEGAPIVEFQVWSSIDPITNQTDPDAGEDSIRLVVSYGDGVYWKWPRSFWITREPGWADRLFEKITKHLDVIVPHAGLLGRRLRRCSDCGGYLLPHPVKRPKAPEKKWYLICYGKDGPTACFKMRTKRDGRQGDRRWKSWLQVK